MKIKPLPKLTDAEKVEEYMAELHHPLKAEINAVREIIMGANSILQERIKWNAPSYYYHEDLVTFNHRNEKRVHLVFHHPGIVEIKSELLEGNYVDRRMVYFSDMEAIEKHKKELTYIVNELVMYIESKSKN